MIIYFAGGGRKIENSKKVIDHKNKNWGVLLSYKDMKKTKDGKGGNRFQELIKNRKNGE